MKKNYFIVFGVLLIIGLFIFGYSNGQKGTSTTTSAGLQVAASFYPLFFFAQEIGGEKATVKNITPPGVEPHDYEPTAKDITSIENSDLLILNGAGFEPWYTKLHGDIQNKNVRVVDVTAGLDLLEGGEEHEEEEENEEEGHEEEAGMDPHVWLDPQLAKKEVMKITEGYIAVDKANADFYKENEKQLLAQLDELDEKFKTGVANCQSKDIITSHTAFAYLAQRYGLNQVAIAGLSPEAEPSVQELAEITKFAKENNVTYIFFETLVSPKLSETVANEIGAKTMVLDPLEGLSDDDIKQGENYFTVMEENLKNLQTALSCNQ